MTVKMTCYANARCTKLSKWIIVRRVALICCILGSLITVCAVAGVTASTVSYIDGLAVSEKRGEMYAVQDVVATASDVSRMDGRPPHVRNLLLRLEEAERAGDVEMATLIIEELRSLPGSPVRDLEDRLVRRLGELNLVLLFKMKCPRWVSLVTVKHGDTASSIASEYGSTVASLNRLNDNALDNMKEGQSIYAINHPRFSLVVHRMTQNADLCLNGKLFKRYELKSVSGLNEGSCEWGRISLSVTEHKELEMLLPQNTSVLVSEM